VIERLAKFVAIPSISRDERALADVLCADLQAAGLKLERQANNIWCAVGDQPRPRLLLNSHLDTVPPGDGWSGDPFTLRRMDDRLVGLGANDAKGCVVALITAVLRWKARLERGQSLGGTIVLALTAEEETSGAGLGTILDALRPLDAALVGEPTQMTPMIAQRGLLVLRGVTRGRTAHPANTLPESAENAIVAAAEQLLRLRDFDWGPVHPLLGRCHGHVTLIHGGIARNVIPDACEFFLDVRTTPAESHEDLHARLARHLQCELHVHSDRLQPIETDAREPIVAAVRAALPGCVPSGSPAMSDMVYLAGVPAVKVGPGESRRSHTPDEWIGTDELERGAAGYERAAQAYFDLMRRPASQRDVTAAAAAEGYTL